MSSLLPLAAYNLAIEPYIPVQAIESEMPVTVRITLAAIDPENIHDDDEQPSTLRILKASPLSRLAYDSEEEDSDLEGESDSEADSEEEREASDDEEMEGDDVEENEEGDSEDDSEDGLSDDEDDVEEYVVCTLSPKSQYQQTLDITISPEEEVFFVVTGSYPVHISGNYIQHPFDDSDDMYDSDSDEEDYDVDSEDGSDYDLTPDEDELAEADFDINDLEDEEDVEGKIEELVEEDENKESKKVSKKENKKRQAEEESKPEVKETKKQKKAREQEEKKKSVQFNKELEQGPTKTEEKKKPAVQTLAGGVVVEDRTVGKGPQAKAGNKVGVRYIGKLKNGSVFDKNTSGKPFQFSLGKGEVIKGWDIGVAGMAVGGERRIVIPAPFAYGKKKLPGIPANSELTFDVKLVSLK